jgi:hypothetical protein
MANTGLAFNDSAGGNRGYNGLWIGNVTSPFGDSDEPSLLREAFFAAAKDAVLPTVVTVAAGIPVLTGTLLDEDGISTPPGVVVTVTKPDGTQLSTASSVYTDDLMIHLDAENNLSAFMIKNPAAGSWVISTQVPDGSEPAFQLIVSTMPTGKSDENDMDATLQAAFQNRFTDEQIAGIVEKFGLAGQSCFWCKVGVWSIAIAISVILAAVGFLFSAESAAILALAAYIGAEAGPTLILVRGLLFIIGKSIGAAITSICQYTKACGPFTADMELGEMSPQGGY